MKETRIHRARLGALLGLLAWIAFSLFPGNSMPVAAQGGIDGTTVGIPRVIPHEFAGDVRKLPQVPAKEKFERELNEPEGTKQGFTTEPLQSSELSAAATIPSASRNFPGLSYSSACTGGRCGAGIPPDTNGDVGPNDYIQAVNSSFGIYSKSGTLLASFTENALWAGSNAGPCDGDGQGDPVVLYDSQADRWILTNFAFPVDASGNPRSPFYECIAVSRSGDPVSGGWWLYGVRTDTSAAGQPPVGTMNDYPKFGIWNECLFYSANGFNMSTGNYVGGEFGSFSLSDMYSHAGLTGALGFRGSTSDYFTMVPSNLSAPGAGGRPPAGTPNYYVQESMNSFAFKVRKFAPGSNCGPGTLGSAVSVSQASYSVPGAEIVPQPNTGVRLDSLRDRLMQKVQYRRIGNTESLWVTHTFRSSSTGPTGLQWAQINVTGGTIRATPVQQQLYHPGDGAYRWMGSIAADKAGNAAMAYSISGGSTFPTVAYTGRLVSDPLNHMSQGETKLMIGSGSQVNNCGGAPCHRWGDYSSISVDPSDGCTFWFTNEFYNSQTSGDSGLWHTRIGSFKFPSCDGVATSTSSSSILTSQGARDGWVRESLPGSGVGGSLSAAGMYIRLGDDANNRQFRGIMSFGTAALPDNAAITSVTLKFKRAGVVGSTPFASLGNISVDVRKGAFSDYPALQLPDFQAPADRNGAMTITNNPVNGWFSASLSPSDFGLINLLGPTQFRLEFAVSTNGNGMADALKIYSGDYTTAAVRPKLIITYTH